MKSWGVKQEMRQLGAGEYRSDLAVLTTEQGELYIDRFRKGISMHLEGPENSVGILFPRSARGQFLACGQDVGNNKLLVFPCGSSADIVIPDLSGSEAVTLPNARFTELSQVLARACNLRDGVAVIEGNTGRMDLLRQTVIRLVAHPGLTPDAEQFSNLLEAIVLYITDSLRKGAGVDNLHSPNARMHIAKRAQAYINEHYQKILCMEDLCHHTGVGVRTLQRSFRQYFDLTISDYVKTVRLNAALRELTAAHRSEKSVTEIALRNGYTHLGRFSTEFRSRFGQSPREALDWTASKKS